MEGKGSEERRGEERRGEMGIDLCDELCSDRYL